MAGIVIPGIKTRRTRSRGRAHHPATSHRATAGSNQGDRGYPRALPSSTSHPRTGERSAHLRPARPPPRVARLEAKVPSCGFIPQMATSSARAPAAAATASGSWAPSTSRRVAARSRPAPATPLERASASGPARTDGPPRSRWATVAPAVGTRRRGGARGRPRARDRARGRRLDLLAPATADERDGESYDQTGQHTIELPELTPSSRLDRFDLVIVGCGPAGLSAADRASSKGLRVALIDPTPLKRWQNNYGVWVDEFEDLGLTDCFNKVWPKAKVVIDDARPDGIDLNRPYGQVNRIALKDKFLARCVAQGVVFGACAVEGVAHEGNGSVVTLKGGADGKFAGTEVHAKMVLDATGHARKLVQFERDFTPGYQAAFGIMCETDGPHGLDLDTMLFMDWRDEHLSPRYKEMNNQHPRSCTPCRSPRRRSSSRRRRWWNGPAWSLTTSRLSSSSAWRRWASRSSPCRRRNTASSPWAASSQRSRRGRSASAAPPAWFTRAPASWCRRLCCPSGPSSTPSWMS